MTTNIAKIYNKHVILLKPLLNEIKKQIKEGDSVVDLGCGTGAYVEVLAKQVGKNGKIVCIDNNQQMILYCRKKFFKPNILFKKLAAEKLSSLEKKFDVVFASLVLQFTKVNRAISEIKKSLKPKGKLILSIPLYRTGINISFDEESKKFKLDFEKNLKDELKKADVKDRPSLKYTNSRSRLFKGLLQKNQFRIFKWNIQPLEKNNLQELLDYYKIPWRSVKILNKPFNIRYKVLSNALKKTFEKYPNYAVKRYYLIAVANNK